MTHELLSLFCGSGGLDHGFQSAGFNTVLALDNSEDAVLSYNANALQKNEVARVADISTLMPKDFVAMIPATAHPVGLIGGPPCQGFSRGNVSADPDDPRNRLPYRYADLLRAANDVYNLHFFVFENVIGLLQPKHRERYKRILGRLRKCGFTVFTHQLNASDFEVPQRRRRLFIIGFNSTLYPAVEFQPPALKSARRTVADAIKGLPRPTFYRKNLEPSDVPHHPNHWTMVPRSPKFHGPQQSSGRSFKILDWNDVSPTVAYGNREIHVHPDGDRRLSVFEALLLQGFPRDYYLAGTFSSQVTQVSNAVPPPMAKAIALQIKSFLKEPVAAK